MKSSGLTEKQLRKLTKMVLSEIALPPGRDRAMSNVLAKLDAEQQNNPLVKFPQMGLQAVNECYSDIIKQIKKLVRATIEKKQNEVREANMEYRIRRADLLHTVAIWRDNIINKDPNMVDELHKHVMEFSGHISQIEQQTQRIYATLVSGHEGSRIGAYRQLKHLNDIINNARKNTDELFSMALKLGFGKEKK